MGRGICERFEHTLVQRSIDLGKTDSPVVRYKLLTRGNNALVEEIVRRHEIEQVEQRHQEQIADGRRFQQDLADEQDKRAEKRDAANRWHGLKLTLLSLVLTLIGVAAIQYCLPQPPVGNVQIPPPQDKKADHSHYRPDPRQILPNKEEHAEDTEAPKETEKQLKDSESEGTTKTAQAAPPCSTSSE